MKRSIRAKIRRRGNSVATGVELGSPPLGGDGLPEPNLYIVLLRCQKPDPNTCSASSTGDEQLVNR